MLTALLSRLLDPCVPIWMKRYFDFYDPDANPLDLSTASTRPGRRSSMYDPGFSDYEPMQPLIQPPIPQWQVEADDPLNLSRHSTLPGRRSSVYEPIPEFLSPARRRSSVLEPVREAEAPPARRRSSAIAPVVEAPDAPLDDSGSRDDSAIQTDQTHQQASTWQVADDENYSKHQRRMIAAVPRHTTTQEKSQTVEPVITAEVRRSWPDPPEKGERRIVAANYSAVEIHGFFGLIDDGSDGAGRMLIVHVPKWIRGYFLDIKQGDTLHVYHARGKKVGGALTVLSTGRHKYYAPGRRVMTCTVCVPEEQWAPFA